MRSREQILDEIVADMRGLIVRQSGWPTERLISAAAGGAQMLIRSGAPGTKPFSGEQILKLATVLVQLLIELEFAHEEDKHN